LEKPLKHQPYDGSSHPFEIGLRPLDVDSWIEVDHQLGRYLAQKRRLFAAMPGRVFVSEADTGEAQQEVLAMLTGHLLEKFPGIYALNGSAVTIGETGFSVNLEDPSMPALLRAAFLVQEDLVLMRKGEEGWRLVAASVSFPSSWVLLEKFSRPLHEIHAPVPGFGPGTRKAAMIERIFDNLKVEQPVARFNWSVYGDAELFHDSRVGEAPDYASADVAPQLRVERQTLRKLPESGDCLFTIRIHIDPLTALAGHPELVPPFVASLMALDQDQLLYKELAAGRDKLIDRLKALGA